jgi:hypothetical protein
VTTKRITKSLEDAVLDPLDELHDDPEIEVEEEPQMIEFAFDNDGNPIYPE